MSFEHIIGLTAIAAYLVGSISFAIVVSRLRGIADPRSYGSNNPGATNVLRSGDKTAAALTLLGDALKGFVVVLLADSLTSNTLSAEWRELAVAVAGFFVFLGHLFPVYFRFQGGKGVATAFGILLAMDPYLGLAVAVVWLLAALGSRISSLGALSAAVAAPLITAWIFDFGVMFWAVLAIALLLVARHKKNIQQLLAGQEQAFKKKD
jgi:acyl phosphate:glycerol-3-phosphate acyltransferase